MTTTADFAEFIQSTEYETLSSEVRTATKQRILDAIGIALGAIGDEPVEIVRTTVEELDPEGGPCTIWGSPTSASPPEAAMINTSLIRFLDYMDSILLPKGTPHPDDNIGAAVAAAEYDDRSGEELIAGVAIAYEVHGELAEKAPSGYRWDQVQVILSNTSVASKLLGLDYEQTRNAIGIAAAEYNQLSIIREGQISMWKGIASSNRARNAVHTAMLARNGMEGPVDAIEGEWGWKEVIQNRDFHVDFTPGERVLQVMTKKYMLGTHGQAAMEGLEELMERENIDPQEIEHIQVDTYEKALNVMGNRPYPETRETADHSTHYGLAALALDGQLMHEQYTDERIQSEDMRELFHNITIDPDPDLTRLYEDKGEMPYNLTITTSDGNEHYIEKRTFEGHAKTPMSWAQLEEKFHRLAKDIYEEERREAIIDTVKNLEQHEVSELTNLLN